MITANDFRLGNWVNTEYGFCEIASLELYGGRIGVKHPMFNTYVYRNPQIINPIPLTPEVLEKCDDPLSKIGYELRKVIINGCIRLHLHIGISYIQTADYLHEYQNLVFALTGQELEVNL